MNTKFDIDDVPLKFGKHKGETPLQVAERDPNYVVWMHANVLPPPCSRELAISCEHGEREDEAEYGPPEAGDWDDFDVCLGNFGDWGDH